MSLLDTTPYVFVYGTLKYGHGNWSWALSDEDYLGPRTTSEEFVLGDMGFPFAFPKGALEGLDVDEELFKPVLGDLFEVSSMTTMNKLDSLESEGSLYHRKLAQLTDGTTAWMYQCYDPHYLSKLYRCSETDQGEWEWKR